MRSPKSPSGRKANKGEHRAHESERGANNIRLSSCANRADVAAPARVGGGYGAPRPSLLPNLPHEDPDRVRTAGGHRVRRIETKRPNPQEDRLVLLRQIPEQQS